MKYIRGKRKTRFYPKGLGCRGIRLMPLNRTVVAPDNLGSQKSSDFNSSISVQAFPASGHRFFCRLQLSIKDPLEVLDNGTAGIFWLPRLCPDIVLPMLAEESAGK